MGIGEMPKEEIAEHCEVTADDDVDPNFYAKPLNWGALKVFARRLPEGASNINLRLAFEIKSYGGWRLN